MAANGGGNFIYVVVAFATLGGIMFGLDQGNWSGAIVKPPFVEVFCGSDPGCYDAEQLPFRYVDFLAFGSALLQAGAAAGALLLAPTLAGRLGRREAMFLGSLVAITGVLPQTVLTTKPLFLAARSVAGVGVGVVTYALPMFISEIAPAQIRGALGASMQLTMTVGILLASVLNLLPSFTYQLSFSLPSYPAAIVAAGIFCFPMSPRFALLKWGRRGAPEEGAARALASLRRLRGSEELAAAELRELQEGASAEQQEAPWSTLWTDKSIRRRVLLANMLQWVQQFTGVNAILSYGPSIFASAGVPLDKLRSAVVTNCFNTVGTLIMVLVIDRLGRRFLLLLGSASMCIFMGITALLCHLMVELPKDDPSRTAMGWGVLACICGYMSAFAVGWGGVPWVYPSEIFPMDVKEKALSTSVFSQWVANFLIALAIPIQVEIMGSTGLFLFYSVCLAIGFLLVYWLVPETKGRSLEGMDELFGGRALAPGQARELGENLSSASLPGSCACSWVRPLDIEEEQLARTWPNLPDPLRPARKQAMTRVLLSRNGAATLA